MTPGSDSFFVPSFGVSFFCSVAPSCRQPVIATPATGSTTFVFHGWTRRNWFEPLDSRPVPHQMEPGDFGAEGGLQARQGFLTPNAPEYKAVARKRNGHTFPVQRVVLKTPLFCNMFPFYGGVKRVGLAALRGMGAGESCATFAGFAAPYGGHGALSPHRTQPGASRARICIVGGIFVVDGHERKDMCCC